MNKTTIIGIVLAVFLIAGAVFAAASYPERKASFRDKGCPCGCEGNCAGNCGIEGCGCAEGCSVGVCAASSCGDACNLPERASSCGCGR